ncbi:MAG TPA: hypothetical protein VKX49_02295 [Bryobacteraceae bacterium]|nr:hypothetical protein [Bryobacteraceae bacterium]
MRTVIFSLTLLVSPAVADVSGTLTVTSASALDLDAGTSGAWVGDTL